MPRKTTLIVLILVLILPLVWVPSAAAQDTCAGTTYTVQTGDTLTAIASAFGVSVTDIQRVNGIVNADRILIAQVLCIPASAGIGGPSTSTTTNSVLNQGTTDITPSSNLPNTLNAGSTTPIGVVDSLTGFTTTASVTLDVASYQMYIVAPNQIPNTRAAVYISSELGDIGGGRLAGLDVNASGVAEGFATLPVLDYNNRRYYVMVRSWNGRISWSYIDLVSNFN